MLLRAGAGPSFSCPRAARCWSPGSSVPPGGPGVTR